MKNILNLLVVLSLFAFSSCGYNSMQRKEEAVFKAWGDVESSLQRRFDLIPNLVETVKGYAVHEKETLEGVINARSKATSVSLDVKDLASAQKMAEFQGVQGGMSSALSKLMVVAERYPDLKANQNFLDLQTQLEGTENRINIARKRYNQAVSDFNSSIRSFPNSMTNSMFLHLERKEYFKADKGSTSSPKVKF